MHTPEHKRMSETSDEPVPRWQKWGPYVSERSWGNVREDYSWNGDAWNSFPFDMAHEKTFRWGEDGIAGFCDRYQVLVFTPAFWNGKDFILKERLFGLTAPQGNHGEDVKELYYYLDGTPTHSYMKYLYKYPHNHFPYDQLKHENGHRGSVDPEFELIDTNIFAENRYFDIQIEYAKASAEDICIRIEAFNRGKEDAPLHMIPQLLFRNQWSWGDERLAEPEIKVFSQSKEEVCLLADDAKLMPPSNLPFDYHLGKRYLYASAGSTPLFTNNETPAPEIKYTKDAFHKAIIHKQEAFNPEGIGTKSCLHYFFPAVPAQKSVVIHLRLTDRPVQKALKEVDAVIAARKKEADAFYEAIHPPKATSEEKMVQRQAFAGMLWSKQFYYFDVNQWLEGDNTYFPPPAHRENIRNKHWRHLNSSKFHQEHPFFFRDLFVG